MTQGQLNISDARSIQNLSSILKDQFSLGQGTILLQPDMEDAVLIAVIKHAASFGHPFTVIPAPGASDVGHAVLQDIATVAKLQTTARGLFGRP